MRQSFRLHTADPFTYVTVTQWFRVQPSVKAPNASVLDVTASARSASAVIRHTPARGSLDAVDRADTHGECLNTRAGVE